MSDYARKVLESLRHARWDVLARTYGNSHATMVGLVVEWWTASGPRGRTVLEGAPGFQVKGGRKQVDALLCEDDEAVGVVEVEGTDPATTVRKMVEVLSGGHSDLQGVAFALVVLYTTGARGSGSDRSWPCPASQEWLEECRQLSDNARGVPVIVVTLHKDYERNPAGIRGRNTEYYWGQLSRVESRLFMRGRQAALRQIWPRAKGT